MRRANKRQFVIDVGMSVRLASGLTAETSIELCGSGKVIESIECGHEVDSFFQARGEKIIRIF